MEGVFLSIFNVYVCVGRFDVTENFEKKIDLGCN